MARIRFVWRYTFVPSLTIKTNNMVQQKEFMLLFRYEPSNDYQPTEAESQEQHQQWGAFIGNIAIQEKLVSVHQLGFEGKRLSPSKNIEEGIYTAHNQLVGGNMIVKAKDIAEAVEMAKPCPILAMGGTIEVRDIMSM
jgi:hypothetical protein